MPAPALKDFLTQNVKGYLFDDIRSMCDPQPAGGCGYPLLMTVCSGIELLGMLSSYLEQEFQTHRMSDKYFLDYWQKALYPGDRDRRNAGKAVYQLVRHGLAHSFVTKGNLTVVNRAGEPHFTRTPVEVIINAYELATDFTGSYQSEFLDKRLKANTPAIEKRLDEIWTAYTKQADKLWDDLGGLPSSASAAGASGSLMNFTPSMPITSPAGAPGPTGATGPTGAQLGIEAGAVAVPSGGHRCPAQAREPVAGEK